MIEIDGSYHEGGGQIIRTAVSLSCITGEPCRIINIRRGRPTPGLKAQHLIGIRAAAELFSANITGDSIGSQTITFEPGEPSNKNLRVDIGTAGAVTLVLQTLVPTCISLKKPILVDITGGTHVSWSPVYHYFERILLPTLKKMGVDAESEILEYGFYPRGGGKVRIKLNPCSELVPLSLASREGKRKTSVISIASSNLQKAKVAERQIEGARKKINIDESEVLYVDSKSAGSCIFIETKFDNIGLGSSELGRPKMPAENVGMYAAKNIAAEIDTPSLVDSHLSDQLIPFVALARGKSKFITSELTSHMQTNIWTVKKFLDIAFDVNRVNGGFEIVTSGQTTR